MAISGIGNGFSAAQIFNLQETSLTQPSSASSSAGAAGGLGAIFGDSAQISGPGQLFSGLQQLQSQNTTAFQQLTASIAAQLQTAATQTTGGEATFLANLANTFQTAAATGNASVLQPPQSGAGAAADIPGTYNQLGQFTPSLLQTLLSTNGTDLNSLLTNSNSSSGGLDLNSLLGVPSSSGLNLSSLLGGSSSGGLDLSSLLSGSSSSNGLGGLFGGGSSSSNGVDLGQLFQNISQQVNQAVGKLN